MLVVPAPSGPLAHSLVLANERYTPLKIPFGPSLDTLKGIQKINGVFLLSSEDTGGSVLKGVPPDKSVGAWPSVLRRCRKRQQAQEISVVANQEVIPTEGRSGTCIYPGVLNLLFASTSTGANRSYCGFSYTSINI